MIFEPWLKFNIAGKLEHHGIKIEFVGQIELYYDRGNHYEFLSLVKELARPGELTQNTSYDFEFAQVKLYGPGDISPPSLSKVCGPPERM